MKAAVDVKKRFEIQLKRGQTNYFYLRDLAAQRTLRQGELHEDSPDPD